MPESGRAARGTRVVVLLLALAGAVGAVGGGALLVHGLLGSAAGPEAAILSRLESAAAAGLSLPVPGAQAPLVSRQVRMRPTTVHLAEGGMAAVAVTSLDFTGALGDTRVSALGYERVPFILREGQWEPRDGWAPRLVEAVAALEARRRALEAGEVGALDGLRVPGAAPRPEPERDRLLALDGRRYRVEAWLLRSEREEVRVAERYVLSGLQVSGQPPGRPVEESGLRNLSLRLSGQKLYFSPGLM